MDSGQGLNDGFGHWLSGFVDGEGSFTITARGAARGSHTPGFALTLRDDDRGILDEIVRRTGIGRVYDLRAEQLSRGDGYRRGGRADWRVSNKVDALALVALFDRFPLRAKKRRDFDIWREAVLLWAGRSKHRGSGRDPHPVQARLAELRAELVAVRKYV